MGRARILIVEDEELVGLAIKTHLESVGYEAPEVVSSGEKAIDEVRMIEPDLVLMDIRLSGAMDGVEAATTIKDSYHIPVIYLTAYSDPDTLLRAKAADPYGFLVKPLDERSLEATIEMALHKNVVQRELRRTNRRLETILQSMGEGIVVAGMKGFVEYANAAASAYLGLSTAATQTSLVRLARFAHSRSDEPVPLPLDEVLAHGRSLSFRDCFLVTTDGSWRAVDLNLEPHRDESGVARGVVLSFRDVFETRKVFDLVKGELESAAEVHQGLLPADGTKIGPVRMHGFLFPAAYGAGDLYGFHAIDGTHSAFYIMDVGGHGVVAASLALLVNRLLAPDANVESGSAVLGVDLRDPQAVVERLNRLFFGVEEVFFTICYGVIDQVARVVRLVRAGHPFPILERNGARIEEIDSGGHAVGLAAELSLTAVDLAFEPGDRLFLYTDGLIECGNPAMHPFTRERLVGLIRDSAADQLSAAVARVAEQVSRWRGTGSFNDDVALVGFEMGPRD